MKASTEAKAQRKDVVMGVIKDPWICVREVLTARPMLIHHPFGLPDRFVARRIYPARNARGLCDHDRMSSHVRPWMVFANSKLSVHTQGRSGNMTVCTIRSLTRGASQNRGVTQYRIYNSLAPFHWTQEHPQQMQSRLPPSHLQNGELGIRLLQEVRHQACCEPSA